MAFEKLEDLPQEAKELPVAAQRTFLAAYNSYGENSGDNQAALEVAWNTVKNDYEQGADGKWHWKNKEPLETNKTVQSAGN